MKFFLLDGPELSLAVAGGKGLNLNRMLAAGLPVPPGFVIPTAAYQEFVTDNQLAAQIESAWLTLLDADATAFETTAELLHLCFIQSSMSAEVASSIADAYSALGDGEPAVAVRSSATAEDLPNASFAGQQDTYLNIVGIDGVLDAVKRCWASLWTARAMAYRVRQGINPGAVSLAVVVQTLVPATASGVLFTVNPVTGAADELIINATWGLGEALVAGKVNPDTIVADKSTGEIRQVDLGEKAIMTAPVAAGTSEVDVDTDRRGQPVLSSTQVAELARRGRQLEALFGSPQDVEWAIVDGALFLVQSRPVTTVVKPVDVPSKDDWLPDNGCETQPFDFWTQQDMGERWPDPVTPLTWSISEPMNQVSMDEMIAGLKAPYAGKIRWTKRVFGHVYLNEGALLHAYTDGFGMPFAMIESGLSHPDARPQHANGWRWGKVLRHLPWYWRVAIQWERNAARFEADFLRIDHWVDDFMQRDLTGESDAALFSEARDIWYARVLKYINYHASATSLSLGAYTQMGALMEKRMGDRTVAQTLAGGLTGVIAAEMAPALWEMAETLRRLGLEHLLIEFESDAALAALYTEPGAQPFFDQFDRFLQRHGHRCMVEAELLYPRWIEEPAQVIESLACYLRLSEAPVLAVSGMAEHKRIESTVQVEHQLNRFQRSSFRRALKRLHRFTRLRDNGQNYLVKLMLPMRHLYAVLGERWAARGWLTTPDAIFFLVQAEIGTVSIASDPAAIGLDLQAIADSRRMAYDYWFGQPTPDALDAHGKPVATIGTSWAAETTMVGIAASPGQKTGRARVVMSPREAVRLEPGDILVTRATDPGWTPVFSVIGGAVIEIGGMLSHGAIVAREYGLPAVVNVPQATQRIKDGQTITVDGTTGRVSWAKLE